MPNMFRMLEHDHRVIVDLLEKVTQPRGDAGFDDAGRRSLIDRLVAASSRHEVTEEIAFWPVVARAVDGGSGLRREGLRQERDSKYLLDALRSKGSDEEFEGLLQEVAGSLRRHIEFEEQTVWPALRGAIGPLTEGLTGWRLLMASKAAPTRPHPGGPDHPIGLASAGTAAAFSDRVVDRLTGRRARTGSGGGHDGSVAGMAADTTAADPVAFLTEAHAGIEALLRQVERDDRPSGDLVAQLVRDLSVHDAIEREYLYPVLRRRLERGNSQYPHWISEHGQIAAVLAEIDRRPELDEHRLGELRRLATLVRTHVEEEEGSVFPAMRLHLTPGELAGLATDLRRAAGRAPTRPHSHIAGAGLGARVSRLVAGPIDRTRDVLSGRR